MADTPVEGVPEESEAEAFLGTYKTKEEAEKGIKERGDKISQQGQEIAEMKARLAASEGNAELLKTLTEKVAAKPEAEVKDPQAEVDAVVAKIAKAMEDGDYDTAARLNLQVQSGWLGQSEAQQEKARKEAVAELADSLGTTVKSLEKRLAERDPDVLAYGEKAAEIAETAGVELSDENRGMFLKIAKATAGTEHPPRHDLPGGGQPTRVAGGDDDDSVNLTDAQKEAIGFNDLSPAKQKEWTRMQKEKAKAKGVR